MKNNRLILSVIIGFSLFSLHKAQARVGDNMPQKATVFENQSQPDLVIPPIEYPRCPKNTSPSCLSPFGNPTPVECSEEGCYVCHLDPVIMNAQRCARGFTLMRGVVGWGGYHCESVCGNRCAMEMSRRIDSIDPRLSFLFTPQEIPQYIFDLFHDCLTQCRDPETISQEERCESHYVYKAGDGAFFNHPRLDELFRMVGYLCELPRDAGGDETKICTQCGMYGRLGNNPGEIYCSPVRN